MARYEDYACHRNAIFSPIGQADILILGNSRSKRAMNVTQLKSYSNEEQSFIDLSKNWRGNELLYAFAQDYLSNHKPKYLLLEFSPGAGVERRYHPNSHKTLKTLDLAKLVLTDEMHGNFSNRMKALKKLYTTRLEDREKMVSVELDYLGNNIVFDADYKDCTPIREKYKTERLAKARKKLKPNWKKQNKSWDLQASDNASDLAAVYAKKIISLAKSKNIKTFMYHVPRFGDAAISESFKETVEQEFEVPFLVPPLKLHKALHDEGGFRDPTHLALQGSNLYAEWIIGELKGLDVIK